MKNKLIKYWGLIAILFIAATVIIVGISGKIKTYEVPIYSNVKVAYMSEKFGDSEEIGRIYNVKEIKINYITNRITIKWVVEGERVKYTFDKKYTFYAWNNNEWTVFWIGH